MNASAPNPPGAEVPPAKSELRDEVLRHDLEYWGDSFWRNEEAGERRVSFYITLVTAVMAGLAGLYQQMLDHPPASGGTPEDVLHRVAVPALLGLTLVGLITFMRMILRNAVTDGYKENADAIRRFALGSSTFKGLYRPVQEPRDRDGVC